MKKIFILGFLIAPLIWSCSEKEENIPGDTIKILSLTATANPVKAWDTTEITVVATGDHLQYGWEANHGSIQGGGTTIKYAAGECCVGLNTITCRAFNDTGEISDTIMIRVTSYFDKKKK